jgi:hypothetical protein
MEAGRTHEHAHGEEDAQRRLGMDQILQHNSSIPLDYSSRRLVEELVVQECRELVEEHQEQHTAAVHAQQRIELTASQDYQIIHHES